ncbi:DUF4124 domain-containing protein [Acinetobacter sp.]|uniref:DUF4124 domain-containing protein n=1 Tax=Acinetobacter sp. TaxID=472 RepID=UPI0025834C93|nr:DUF4124 domain-containing protein [Acinetobacter sp.]
MKQHQRFTYTVFVSTIFTLLSLTAATGHAKQYYKWVDSNGSTHYTTTPPPKNARNKSKVDTYGYRGTSSPTSQPTAPPATAPNNQPNTQQNAPQHSQPANAAPVINPPNTQPPAMIPQNGQSGVNNDSVPR